MAGWLPVSRQLKCGFKLDDLQDPSPTRTLFESVKWYDGLYSFT